MGRSGITLDHFLREVRSCTLCAGKIPEPRPVFRFQSSAKILIVGQAPGRKVHETGIPWNDVSGELLRNWLNLDRETFYDESRIAIIPSALCFPGTESGKGDLPPPDICFKTWHHRFLEWFEPELTLAVGSYAICNYLQTNSLVSEVVHDWQKYLNAMKIFPLPHPSPRNRKWLADRPWFETEVIPALRETINSILR